MLQLLEKPNLAVIDGTYARAAMGYLASYTGPNGTKSPAQYGFRAIDQNGNAIFDSMGLIAVMNSLGNQDTGVINQSVTSTTNVTVTNSSFNVTATRSITLRVESIVQLAVTTGDGSGNDFLYVKINVDNTDYYPAALTGAGVRGYTTQTLLATIAVAAGNHIIKLTTLVGTATTTGAVAQAHTWCYSMGA